MKLSRRIKSLVILSLMIVLLPVSFVQASEVSTSANTIYFPEDIGVGGTGDPEPKPNTPQGQRPVKPSQRPSGFLPQTGEVKSMVFTILGFIALLLVGLTIFLKSKKYKKENEEI